MSNINQDVNLATSFSLFLLAFIVSFFYKTLSIVLMTIIIGPIVYSLNYLSKEHNMKEEINLFIFTYIVSLIFCYLFLHKILIVEVFIALIFYVLAKKINRNLLTKCTNPDNPECLFIVASITSLILSFIIFLISMI